MTTSAHGCTNFSEPIFLPIACLRIQPDDHDNSTIVGFILISPENVLQKQQIRVTYLRHVLLMGAV